MLLISGVIKLATLDGEEMSTFINGSRLKKFYEPLTQSMLDQIHSAKTKKEALETLKLEAQEEARQRKLKLRGKQDRHVYVADQLEPSIIPPFLLWLQLINYQTSCMGDAIIDFGAKCNLISHVTWQKLGKPALNPSKFHLVDFKGERSQYIGEILLHIRVQDQAMMVSFQVLPTKGCDWKLLLGRAWM